MLEIGQGPHFHSFVNLFFSAYYWYIFDECKTYKLNYLKLDCLIRWNWFSQIFFFHLMMFRFTIFQLCFTKFQFPLILSVPEKLKSTIFGMLNNLKTTSAKSINLHTIRKLIEYSLKKPCKENIYSNRFRGIAAWR